MDKIKELKEQIEKVFNEELNLEKLNDLKVEYLGKKGLITELNACIKELPNEEKKEFGKNVNEVKTLFNTKYEEVKEMLERDAINKKLESERIDITLPSTKMSVGAPNILEKVIEEVEELLMSLGYDVVDGPEIEEDRFNFELLNIPKGHPARDAQDTFYIEDETMLLRSQTSPVQARTMLKGEGKEPIRMICPGKTYRRDDDDATHSHQFMQIEGLLIDKDISCFNCKGKGCSLCKNTGWITVAGAGIVHPNVLRNCGYDPEVWSGFAFGFGAERLAMLKYGINDIRVFYQTDLRELNIFDRKDVD